MRVEKLPLSESVKGAPILVDAFSTPGTLVHRVPDSAAIIDTVHLWAFNTDGVTPSATFEFGSSSVTFESPTLQLNPVKAIDGLVLEGGKDLRFYDGSGALSIAVVGYVLRIYKDQEGVV